MAGHFPFPDDIDVFQLLIAVIPELCHHNFSETTAIRHRHHSNTGLKMIVAFVITWMVLKMVLIRAAIKVRFKPLVKLLGIAVALCCH